MEVLSNWCAALRLPAIWRRWDCRVGEHAAAHQTWGGRHMQVLQVACSVRGHYRCTRRHAAEAAPASC